MKPVRVVVRPPVTVLDPDTVAQFEAWSRHVVPQVLPPHPAVLVLVFDEVTLISAGGITALLELERRLDGYTLRLADVQRSVRRVLALCRQERWLLDADDPGSNVD